MEAEQLFSVFTADKIKGNESKLHHSYFKKTTAHITEVHMHYLEVIKIMCPEWKESYLPRTILPFFSLPFLFNGLPASKSLQLQNADSVNGITISNQWPSSTNSTSRISLRVYHHYSNSGLNISHVEYFNRLVSGLLKLRLSFLASILHFVNQCSFLKAHPLARISFTNFTWQAVGNCPKF